MAGREINYINLITDLKKAGRMNKKKLMNILTRYNIPKLESLEQVVLDYVFSINDNELRYKFFDMLAESNNLPIMHECYSIIYSGISKEEYIAKRIKNGINSKGSLNLGYEICMKIIGQSVFLQNVQKTITEYKEYVFSRNSYTVVRMLEQVNYINLITDLKKAGRSNKNELISILYRYNVPKIESLERRVLDYVFSINDDEIRYKFFDMLAESNNLPIMHECYAVLYSDVPKEEYISHQVKNVGKSRESLTLKYELCMKIVGQSAFLQRMQITIIECKKNILENNSHKGSKVVSHKSRNRAAMRY